MTIISPRDVHYSYAEYMRLEDESSARHEYIDGEICAMAGGTPDHGALAARIIELVGPQLPRGCRTFTSDVRVRIPSLNITTYPDLFVACGAKRAEDDPIAITNPVLIVEVTSKSTESYDRNTKLDYYHSIASLSEVLIVSHREPRITIHRRAGLEWTVEEARAGETLRLDSIGGELEVDEVYIDPLQDIR